ncbi:hypothetical protein BHE74_00034586 [Ensete ventricosum]|nr:hypothetical protein GW17_00044677 [Ensete ventricosum]RWW58534.1 hypothetical protein BHE74_00034586 [Ensete ventricosum]RZR87723.1 hypothetical protein BHM03_00015182 [Ensete ventricosum]
MAAASLISQRLYSSFLRFSWRSASIPSIPNSFTAPTQLQAYFPCQLCSTQGNLICAEQNTSLAPSNPTERTVWTFGQKATLELTQ